MLEEVNKWFEYGLEYRNDGELLKHIPRLCEIQSVIVGKGKEIQTSVGARVEDFKVRLVFEKGIDLKKSVFIDGENGCIYSVHNKTCRLLISPSEFLSAMCAARPEERSIGCEKKNPATNWCAENCPYWEVLERGTVRNIKESTDPMTRRRVWTAIWRITFRERLPRTFRYTPCATCGHLVRDIYDGRNKPD